MLVLVVVKWQTENKWIVLSVFRDKSYMGKIKWGRMMRVRVEAGGGIGLALFHGMISESPRWKATFGQNLEGLREPCRYPGRRAPIRGKNKSEGPWISNVLILLGERKETKVNWHTVREVGKDEGGKALAIRGWGQIMWNVLGHFNDFDFYGEYRWRFFWAEDLNLCV